MWVYFSLFGVSWQTLLQIYIPVFLSQIDVAAIVRSFDQNMSHPNN